MVTAPVSVGIIATSFTVRGRIASQGRAVVSIGVLLFAVGVAGMTVVIEAVQQIVNAAGSAIVSTVYLATVTPGVPSSGVLPCLLLTLAITAACATSIPLLPRRGALAH